MSKINPINFSNITELEDLLRWIAVYTGQLTPVINGKIQFHDNIQSQQIEVKFTLANTDQSIVHNLNKTGVKYIVTDKDVSCDIYKGQKDDTLNTIFLRSTVANSTVTLELI